MALTTAVTPSAMPFRLTGLQSVMFHCLGMEREEVCWGFRHMKMLTVRVWRWPPLFDSHV